MLDQIAAEEKQQQQQWLQPLQQLQQQLNLQQPQFNLQQQQLELQQQELQLLQGQQQLNLQRREPQQQHLLQEQQQLNLQQQEHKQQPEDEDITDWLMSRSLEDNLVDSRMLQRQQKEQPHKKWCLKHRLDQNGAVESTIVGENHITSWQPLILPVGGGSPRHIDVIHLERSGTEFSDADMFL